MPLFQSGKKPYFDADLVIGRIGRINMMSSGFQHATDEEVNNLVPPNVADVGDSIGKHASVNPPPKAKLCLNEKSSRRTARSVGEKRASVSTDRVCKTVDSERSNEDFLESLGISLDTDLIADADTHASVTGIYARADPHFQRSDALSRRRVVLSHPVLRRYYLGKRVDLQIRGCRSVPYPPPEDMRAGKQMMLTDAHTEGVPHVEFILGGDYDEFCRIFLMQPIGFRLDSVQKSAPSQPIGFRLDSVQRSGPSTRTPRRRPPTDPSSSTPVEGPSRAGPSRSTGPSRAPRAVIDATGPLHPDLANLHLSYSISYHTPDGTLAFREVSLANVNHWNLPSDSINEVPDGLVSQMMELILGMEQELSSAWTLRAFDDQRRRRPHR
ncbi:hypothetical protein JCGZ_06032 [Jatropha curcas]|uniref:Uncharacterized protein n=1 Tax=Jatropha curcas TaxID=180498 RepID=A0A067JK79_JATCU|nr:hypothetical protein JCGZ_06032 [Jatropha curcas]